MHKYIPYDVNTNSAINMYLSLLRNRNRMEIVAEGDTLIVNCYLLPGNKLPPSEDSDGGIYWFSFAFAKLCFTELSG